MLYWYTYGPDYKKGDSFSQDADALKLTSKAAHLLGVAEQAEPVRPHASAENRLVCDQKPSPFDARNDRPNNLTRRDL